MKPASYARQILSGSLSLNKAMFQPDWQYLKQHLLWLNDQVTRCLLEGDPDQADRYLDEMEIIQRCLEHVIDTGDLPKR